MKIKGDRVVCGKEGEGLDFEKYDPEDEECKNCYLRGQCVSHKYALEKMKKEKYYPPSPKQYLVRKKKSVKPKSKRKKGCSCK